MVLLEIPDGSFALELERARERAGKGRTPARSGSAVLVQMRRAIAASMPNGLGQNKSVKSISCPTDRTNEHGETAITMVGTP